MDKAITFFISETTKPKAELCGGSDGRCVVRRAAHMISGSSPTNVCHMCIVCGSNASGAILAAKRSAGVTQEVNLSNPLHASDKACKSEIQPVFASRAASLSPEVQNRGISGLTKRTNVL